MLSASAIRRWCWIHKWTSLICTVFLLMLCLTGLPLIFHHEIDHAFSDLEEPANLPASAPRASIDRVVESAKAARPGEVPHIIAADAEEPEVLYVGMGKTPSSPLPDDTTVVVDSRTAKVLGQEKFGEGGFMDWMYLLHVEMFAGIPGKLFLGGMAALFLVALVSGVVIYAPFMRERSFGVVRRERGRRLKWLDLHNLLGITIAVWAFVVGATGMINTWADLLLKLWQFQELGAMTAPYRDKPAVTDLASVDQVVAISRASEPGMDFRFIAFPGNVFSSPHHYVVFMRGDKALTGRILKPVLVDAKTGAFSDKRDMPWYITSLLVSQPLHFGDYGGMPLKIIWALFDLVTIVVLVSGVYLWWKRRKIPVEIDLRSSESREDRAPVTTEETRSI
jgi:uncharacterized iron-regulated membrane protein